MRNNNELEEVRKNLFKVYRDIFSGVIKESFLIDIYTRIEKDPIFGRLLYKSVNENPLSFQQVVCGKNAGSINISKMIVMSHYMNSIALSDVERGRMQRDTKYIDELVDEVVRMYQVERIAAPYFSNASLETFLPIIYYMSAIINLCGEYFDNFANGQIKMNPSYNSQFNHGVLFKLITKFKACISLADIRAVDELATIFRSLAELFMCFALLWDEDEEAIKEYYTLNKITIEYNRGKDIPDDIKKESKNFKGGIVSFINYGWIRKTKYFDNLNTEERTISLGTLAKLLDIKYFGIMPEYGTTLYQIYKTCNPQTHGTLLFFNYFQLELYIFQNLSVMLSLVSTIMSEKLFSFELTFDDLNLIEELNKHICKARKISESLKNNQELLNKTNEDYKARAICSLKMIS